jgi:hypothetical protein
MFKYIDANNFFLFEVCQNGTYNLANFSKGKWSSRYANARSNSANRQAVKQLNVVAVVVRGITMSMYVNGQNIDTATSDILTRSAFGQGRIGLVASDEVMPTSVIYRDARV